MTVNDLEALAAYLHEHSKACTACGMKRITTCNNEWPLKQRCLDCGEVWLEFADGRVVVPAKTLT